MNNKILNIHTNAYEKWKSQTQDTFEFSVLVCSAVPTLKRNIQLFEKGVIDTMTKADHYASKEEVSSERQTQMNTELKARAVGYKQKLAKYTLLSNFSFFESYIHDVIYEFIDSHGGKEQLLSNAKQKTLENDNREIEKLRRKIRRANKVRSYQQYVSASNKLDGLGYRFPSEQFSTYGIKMLIERLSNLRSVEIPDLLSDGFSLDLTDQEISDFHGIRDIRNKIAHGDPVELDLRGVANKCLIIREIVKKVDQHLLRYFFISETFPKGAEKI
ncbi:hypothetical protein ERW49_18280 [Aliivibrio finisterrensis]|uniref:RiboL-PSP-HEPN domain-containing protein n=1 Tax=Aliivibrio finisterrensis TaxID=511998 RepID=A0A4Q5KAN3_9GAMM|nr:HEPN domain-containing protein [Aliivibrio finisterrensis]RYU42123.1 hypothetical protein ERW49_18280 [Aliivibrio finisterrensis]